MDCNSLSDHGLTDSGQHGSPDLEIRQVGAWMWGPKHQGELHLS